MQRSVIGVCVLLTSVAVAPGPFSVSFAEQPSSGQATADEGVIATRRFQIDDYSREEELRPVPAISPDGRALAFEIRRALITQPTAALQESVARGDVWIQSAPDQPARNLTHGSEDGSGWWQPRWSPDGERLAFLSSRGGNVSPWIWERATDKIRRISADGIDFSENGGCRWIDAWRLVCLAVAEGELSTTANYVGSPIEQAKAAWAKAARAEATVNVMNSLESAEAPGRLLLIDARSGTQRVLAKTVIGTWGRRTWWLSPEGNAVVYVPSAVSGYMVDEQFIMGRPAPIAVVRPSGGPLQTSALLPSNVMTDTVSLSRDGREVAFYALGQALVDPEVLYGEQRAKDVVHERPATKENPARLWKLNLESGRAEQLSTGDLDLGRTLQPPPFQWLASGDLLFRGKRLSARLNVHEEGKDTWLVLGRNGRLRTLVSTEYEVPPSLHAVEGGRALAGLLRGEVIRIDPQTGAIRNVTSNFDAPVHELRRDDLGGRSAQVAIRAGTGNGEQAQKQLASIRHYVYSPIDGVGYYLLDLASSQVTEMPVPKETATLRALTVVSGHWTALFFAEDPAGTFVWRCSSGRVPQGVLAINSYRRQVQRFAERVYDYTGMNGEPLKARVVFPADYSPSRRYPLVVDSDIGSTETTSPTMFDVGVRKTQAYQDQDAAVFASAGYAYVFVSTPTTAMDRSGRANLLLWTAGVMPAVDKAIELGIADRDRLFLYGMSSFGFGVYGLVTQTSRFKAAVAQDGWVDQTALSLTYAASYRYSAQQPFSSGAGPRYSNSRLPFWRDVEQYRRNSPLMYVDRVQTPLMIIHGEFDFLPLWQAEMFFAALVQQRKPAQLLRYWGEGHGNAIPANIRDGYQRILAWFDSYGDILRDGSGRIVFDSDRAKPRAGAPALHPEDFARFEPFVAVPLSTSHHVSPER